MLGFPWPPKNGCNLLAVIVARAQTSTSINPPSHQLNQDLASVWKSPKIACFPTNCCKAVKLATQPPSASTLRCCCCSFPSYSSCFSICVCDVNVWEISIPVYITNNNIFPRRKTVIKSYEEKWIDDDDICKYQYLQYKGNAFHERKPELCHKHYIVVWMFRAKKSYLSLGWFRILLYFPMLVSQCVSLSQAWHLNSSQ